MINHNPTWIVNDDGTNKIEEICTVFMLNGKAYMQFAKSDSIALFNIDELQVMVAKKLLIEEK